MIDETDVAYVAGLVDALGRVRTRETTAGTLIAELSISSGNVSALSYVAHLTGVRVVRTSRRYPRVGCREHCPDPHRVVESASARWQLTGARAVVVLRAIRPYLRALGDTVDEVLDMTADAPSKPGTTRRMISLGWPDAA